MFVVWLPVVVTDVAPPTKRVLGLLKDTRVTQFWDERRLTSAAIFKAVAENRKWMKPGAPELSWGHKVVWDFVAVFPEGVRWEELIPPPDFYGFPVVEAIDGLEKRLIADASIASDP